MVECNDYWCEHFNKNSIACNQCTKGYNEKDDTGIKTIIKIREFEQIKQKKKYNVQEQSR